MLALLIETSTERSVVFLVDGDQNKTVSAAYFPVGYHSSKFLLVEIEKAFRHTGRSLGDLTFIGVGQGPGSYTGMRIGAMAAKTLSYAKKIPLVGVCTLSCFVPSVDGPFATFIDAKMGGIYYRIGERRNGKTRYVTEPTVATLEVAKETLTSLPLLVSPVVARIEKLLGTPAPHSSWRFEELAPDPLQMYCLAADGYRRGEFTTDGSLELLYMRKTQAEISKLQG